MSNKTVYFQDIGLLDYKRCWDYQHQLFDEIVALKVKNRTTPESTKTPNYLLFCEHPNVFTLGKSGTFDNLLLDQDGLEKQNATFYKINRGGDITFHGPGQIVGYPILDLDNFFTDVHKYLRFLEEAIILTLNDFDIVAERYSGLTGVWIDSENPSKARKIAAMGVRMSRWITMHGFALNVNTDLSYFENIIPCGIKDKQVTSIEKELKEKIDVENVKKILKMHLSNLFEMELVTQNNLNETLC